MVLSNGGRLPANPRTGAIESAAAPSPWLLVVLLSVGFLNCGEGISVGLLLSALSCNLCLRHGRRPSALQLHLRRRFEGVIEIDGNEHHISGIGNGALSALANALKNLGIDLDIADYKEHSIEPRKEAGAKGRDTQAATFIECTASGQSQRVWGVGIHEDVVQSSLFALLSAASSVSSSPPPSTSLSSALGVFADDG